MGRVFRHSSLIRSIEHISSPDAALAAPRWQVPRRLTPYQKLKQSRNKNCTHEGVNVYQSDRSGFIPDLIAPIGGRPTETPPLWRRNSGVEGLEEQTSCFSAAAQPHKSDPLC